jgi:hypothetical protein
MINQENAALNELIDQLNNLDRLVADLNSLNNDNMFRYLSKNARNKLMTGLMESSGAVEDAAKATYRSFKKVKRERIPEEVADLLLAGNLDAAIAYAPVVTGTQASSSFPSD